MLAYLEMRLLAVEVFDHMLRSLQVKLDVLNLAVLFFGVVDLGPLSLAVVGKESSELGIDLEVLVLWTLGLEPGELTVFADHLNDISSSNFRLLHY